MFDNTRYSNGDVLDLARTSYDGYGGGGRVSYEVSPDLKPFVDGAYSWRVHDQPTDYNGFYRDSNGFMLRGGATFNVTELVKGEVSGGYAERHYADWRLPPLRGPVIDASLIYTPSALTTLTLRGSTTLNETTLANGVLTQSVSLQLSHDLLRNLNVSLLASYYNNNYQGADVVERGGSIGVKLDYKITRSISLRGSYMHELLDSTFPNADYTANVYRSSFDQAFAFPGGLAPMWMMAPFILNSLLNFVVSLLVAKFLGLAEYGRFVLALAVAVVVQTLLFDWLRLAATRFYSERDRLERPQIRATLDAAFAVPAALAALLAIVIWALRIDLTLTHDLAALAIGVAISNGLFDFASALVRARFQDRAYGALVISKNLLAFALTVGGALLFRSASVALVGMMISVAGSLVVGRAGLIDANAPLRRRGARTRHALSDLWPADRAGEFPLSDRAADQSRGGVAD